MQAATKSQWNQRRLQAFIKTSLANRPVFVVSNREPYSHVTTSSGEVTPVFAAGGLVTALEPLMRASHGMWIAHGSGNADRKSSDSDGKVRVPPGKDSYTLKRVWLSEAQVKGYYDGFANEGLWPMCHNTPVSPKYRQADFEMYRQVNQIFADAIVEEFDDRPPVVLVQDYHLAMLPKLIKDRRPDAQVALFWHIPWPEVSRASNNPYIGEILDHMAASDLIGFHVSEYRQTFLDSVAALTSLPVDAARAEISQGAHTAVVSEFPISHGGGLKSTVTPTDRLHINRLRRKYKLHGKSVAFSVDRLDYTKGITQRLEAIERFLQQNPDRHGKITFVQIAAPSRSNLKAYAALTGAVRGMVHRINHEFGTDAWHPIVYLERHHTIKQIMRFYALADMCIVSSLHDGMNLVAKEFVASRADENGVLLLSKYTGAATELTQAIMIDPYHTDEFAAAISQAITMSRQEKRKRIAAMRRHIAQHNIYWWGESLLKKLTDKIA